MEHYSNYLEAKIFEGAAVSSEELNCIKYNKVVISRKVFDAIFKVLPRDPPTPIYALLHHILKRAFLTQI